MGRGVGSRDQESPDIVLDDIQMSAFWGQKKDARVRGLGTSRPRMDDNCSLLPGEAVAGPIAASRDFRANLRTIPLEASMFL